MKTLNALLIALTLTLNTGATIFASEPPQVQTGCISLPMIRQQQAQVFSGNGSEVIEVYLEAGDHIITAVQCSGKGLRIEFYNFDGNRVAFPVDCAGKCDTKSTFSIKTTGTYLLNVESGDRWNITIN